MSVQLVLYAQKLNFVYDNSIPILVNGVEQKNAWFGGLQAPQFSTIDINNDGKKDLFVFDKYDNTVSIFLNENDEYVYYPDYDSLFPTMSGWVVLRDYNCDGKEDIFTFNAGGIAVYENTSIGDVVSFNKITSFLTTTDAQPILVPFTDMPSIEDIDFDGDLDILTFDGAGSYIVFYKNTHIENSTSCNLLKFEIETICWGDFSEGGLNNSITLNDDCGGKITPNDNQQQKNNLHAGSTILAFDNDGDNDSDLLIGDISANNLVFLRNGNNNTNAIMDLVLDSFPTIKPVNLPIFVAPYYIDVDFDGKRDLLAVPNDGSEVSGKNFEQILMYKNTGTDASPVFTFSSNNFLLESSIDLGSGAIPAFLDYDLDGDMDLIVGNYAYRTSAANSKNGLALFENIGTNTSPKFELKNTDFANTSSLNLFSTSPTFGDLDGDGDMDMLLGEFSGKLYYFKNIAALGSTVDFVLDSSYYAGIDIGSNATPYLVDIDRDNDLDLIIGERNGNINYFENLGDSTQPNFLLNTDSVGKISIKSSLINAGYTVPVVLDFDNDGKYDLALGTYDGDIYFYTNIEDQLHSKVEPIINSYYNRKTTHFGNVNYGKRSAPALADLNGDTLIDLLVGLYRGGLVYFKNDSDSSLGITNNNPLNIQIFPNPSSGVFNIQLDQNEPLNYSIYTILGEEVSNGIVNIGNTTLDLSQQANGIYYLILSNKEKIVLSKKLFVL